MKPVTTWLLWTLAALLPACEADESPQPAAPTTATTAAAVPTSSAAPVAAAPTATAAPPTPEPTPEPPPEGMVRIEGAIFLMGAFHMRGNPEERPAHEAIVPSFFMDTTEVTMAAYQKCVEAGACKPTHRQGRFCNIKLEDRDDHPVNCVDLHMAKAYCEHMGKRLPTEREWEFAASGGERRPYSWGDAEPTKENNCYDHPGGSCPVKSFAPGAFGLYDMTGNVWEWTESRFTPYPSRPTADPIERGFRYVYRGGSWSRRFPKWMTTVLRNRYKPQEFSAAIGIRCVKTVEPLSCPEKTKAEGGICVRSEGEPMCEPGHAYDGELCVPEGSLSLLAGGTPPAVTSGGSGGGTPDGVAGSTPDGVAGGAAAVDDKPPVITRSRTPQHDEDCKRHWPATPASYLFKGGNNYPSRKPTVAAAGCVPRDMGWNWTSACCPG